MTTDFKRPLDRFQLIVHDARGEPIAAYKRTTRFGGMLGPAITGNFFVVVASKRGKSPNDPAVISLIRTFPWRCH